MDFQQRYGKLNADQKRAVDALEGAVLVVAGPGSGKTEILALRVANIIKSTDAGASSILCLTFTDSAASNMRARLASLIGPEAYRVQIGTFHAFAQLVAQQYPAYFGSGAELVPAEAVEQRELVAEAIRELPLRDPLRSEHPSQGLTYVGAAVSRITDLKKAGIGPDALEAVLAHNAALFGHIEEHLAVFREKVSAKHLPAYAKAAEAIRGIPRAPFPLAAYGDLATAVARSLEGAVMDAEAAGKATPVSDWKSAHLGKAEAAGTLKARASHERLVSLARVYRRYQELLRERGLRDFDDLIVDLIDALRANPELRAELQEEYQYVLVDEFQDTNGAQAELLALIADAPVAEGNPNLMVVGDDDQSIYRFHGAGLEHILGFAERYPRATVVTMTTNYRSHQGILDLAKGQIAGARERLVGRIAGLSKDLVQGGTYAGSEIAVLEAETRHQERDAVAAFVGEQLAAGTPAGEIAVIARRNRDLEALAPHLAEAGIRVSYERQRDALEDRHVIELVETARAVVALSRDAKDADPLLPRVLAFAFWGIPRLALWQLVRDAYDRKEAIVDLAMRSEEASIKAAAEILAELALESLDGGPDDLVDQLIGTCKTPEGRTSPFREHHFGPAERTERPERLLALVAALRSVLAAFSEAQRGKPASLSELVRFADLRREHEEPVPTRIAASETAVQLLTAHKAKGREFDTVIVLHAATDTWHGRGRGSLLSFPENLPIAPAGDSYDDQLRGLYVAITRARRTLCFATSPAGTRTGSEPLPILEGLPRKAVTVPPKERAELAWQERTELVSEGEQAALKPLVAEYQLTATQLNDFMDVVHGGPQTFFERYVLRFPQQQTASMRFGTAMHAVLERLALEAHQGIAIPDAEELAARVRTELETLHLTGVELEQNAALGAEALAAFCAQRADEIRNATHVEVSFARDRIAIGTARLTGKADVIREEEDGLVIVDYKTGKASADWDEKLKAPQRMGNRRQLLFYALLAQKSPRFADKPVKEAKLTFVVPDKDGNILDLSLVPERDEVERVGRLAEAVHKLVTELRFPDISRYPQTAEGIAAFEEDILTGKVV